MSPGLHYLPADILPRKWLVRQGTKPHEHALHRSKKCLFETMGRVSISSSLVSPAQKKTPLKHLTIENKISHRKQKEDRVSRREHGGNIHTRQQSANLLHRYDPSICTLLTSKQSQPIWPIPRVGHFL